jgi:hypothetical protein
MLLDVRDAAYDQYQAWFFEQKPSPLPHPKPNTHQASKPFSSSPVTEPSGTLGWLRYYFEKTAHWAAQSIEGICRWIEFRLSKGLDGMFHIDSATQTGIKLAPLIPTLHEAHTPWYAWEKYRLPYRDINTPQWSALKSSLKRAFAQGWLTLHPEDNTPEGYLFRPEAPLTDLEWEHFNQHWPGVGQGLPAPLNRLKFCDSVIVQLQRTHQITLAIKLSFDEQLDFIESSKPPSAKSEETVTAIPDFYTAVGQDFQAQQKLAHCYRMGAFEALLGSEEGGTEALLQKGLHPFKPLTRANAIEALSYLQSLR